MKMWHGIMTVSGRDCRPLASALAAPGHAALTCLDAGWPAEPSPWRGFRNTLVTLMDMLRCVAPDDQGPWVAIYQDDAVLCRDFHVWLESALEDAEPNQPLALYANRKEIGQAMAGGRRITKVKHWLGNLGVCYPVQLLPDLLAFGDAYVQQGGRVQYDDMRIRDWADQRFGGMPCAVPCLVQHGDGTRHPSTIGIGMQRSTKWFADDVL